MNIFFASPVLNDMLNGIIKRRRAPLQKVRTKDGKFIEIRRGGPEKDSYFKHNPDTKGDPC
jgi:hypothetical protein